jgi:peptidoglycan/LPS O-acetylase OafA/YrhL
MLYYITVMNRATHTHSRWIDISALGLSGLCLVHCLGGGLLLTVVAALSLQAPDAHDAHIALLAVAAPLALFAFWRGWSKHRRHEPAVLGFVGVALMTLALLQAHGNSSEVILTLIGALLLGLGHIQNLKALKGRATRV